MQTYESDITGTKDDVKPVKITVDGKSGSRDLSAEESAALVAWVTAPGTGDTSALVAATAALRALFAPPAPVTASVKRSAAKSGSKSADPRNAVIREWVGTPAGRAAVGLADDAEISTRGRLPKEWAEAYDAAHAANPAA